MNKKSINLIWVFVGITAIVALILVVYGIYQTVGLPGLERSRSAGKSWASLGAYIQGLGTILLALMALVGAGLGLSQFKQQREREYDLDVVRLQGELVTALRLRNEQENNQIADDRLRTELVLYEGFLRGLLLSRPGLSRAARDMMAASLDDALVDLQVLSRGERSVS